MQGVFYGIEKVDELIRTEILEADRVGRRWDKIQVDRGSLERWWFLWPVGSVGWKDFRQNVVVVIVFDYSWGRWRGGGGGRCGIGVLDRLDVVQ